MLLNILSNSTKMCLFFRNRDLIHTTPIRFSMQSVLKSSPFARARIDQIPLILNSRERSPGYKLEEWLCSRVVMMGLQCCLGYDGLWLSLINLRDPHAASFYVLRSAMALRKP